MTTLRLTDCIGLPVLDEGGAGIGSLSDLAANLDAPLPPVTRLRVRSGLLGGRQDIPFSLVVALDSSQVRLSVAAGELRDDPLRDDELLLRRHVLDAQIVDVVGRRLTRVEDVLLESDASSLRIVGVEVGTGAAFRRLGLGRLAERLATRVVPWDALHLTSDRGHVLHLDATASAYRRLAPEDVAELAARLPAHRAEQLLASVGPESAADTRTHAARALRRRPRRFRLARTRRRARS